MTAVSLPGKAKGKQRKRALGIVNLLITSVGCDILSGMHTSTHLYKHHRFPVGIVRHAVWHCFRFCVSSRDVEALLCERGGTVLLRSHPEVRSQVWTSRCESVVAPAASPGRRWPTGEAFLPLHGARPYLGCAVVQDGTVLDILVQRRRDKKAAKKCFRKLLKGGASTAPVCSSPIN